ncbi:MAG: hypothetical protein QOE63_788 [Acidimicrobiaceae bacterium]
MRATEAIAFTGLVRRGGESTDVHDHRRMTGRGAGWKNARRLRVDRTSRPASSGLVLCGGILNRRRADCT